MPSLNLTYVCSRTINSKFYGNKILDSNKNTNKIPDSNKMADEDDYVILMKNLIASSSTLLSHKISILLSLLNKTLI